MKGDGVVGEQPHLAAGAHFDYDSGVPLTTPSGIMNGHYELEREDGVALIAEIPAFSLDAPNTPRAVH